MKTQWSQILTQLQNELSRGDFTVWIAPLDGFIDYTDELSPRLIIKAKSSYVANWVKSKYLSAIQRVCLAMLGTAPRIDFEVVSTSISQSPTLASTPKSPEQFVTELPTAPSVLASSEQLTLTAPGVSYSQTRNCNLNKLKHSFDTFVVGECNHLAYAAANNILMPNTSLDMLFLSSKPGLGKTHLTQALGRAMHQKSSKEQLSMAYITGEEFSSQFIQACRFRDTATFRSRFKNLDLLLFEDVHILNGKEKTQEELLTIVKILQDNGAKVVFTSSLAVQDLKDLDSHLVSRFHSGFLTTLEAPDFDTKKNLLIKKAALRNLKLPAEVAELFAEKLHGDVRLLESSLNNLILKSQILNEPLTPELAYSVIAQVVPHAPENTLAEILSLVCSCYDVTEQQLTSRTRKKDYVMARNTAFYLMHKYSDLTLQKIGAHFGKQHSTVSKAISQVEEELSRNSRVGMQLSHSIRAIEAKATFI